MCKKLFIYRERERERERERARETVETSGKQSPDYSTAACETRHRNYFNLSIAVRKYSGELLPLTPLAVRAINVILILLTGEGGVHQHCVYLKLCARVIIHGAKLQTNGNGKKGREPKKKDPVVGRTTKRY